ncbi:mycothione reductase [Leucobacter rhizosphaerae]|uniref:Mycothione reductase n=1 Tax=Leucobacter rhizosphaerae TaxID=2932245 RepID=A0ABY4FZ90_9MICO|nr:mycothione reductase [Leucobacter rhizosphaerae]UOQ61409.1 mycothione reductase [Leucobacter rhizosphaerae]
MTTRTADLAIIGSGSGNSLITPFWDDRRVVIAERGVFGGTCLNVGCIPTKMYVRPATLARSGEEAARVDVTLRTEAVDWPGMRDRIFSRIDAISAAGEHYRAVELDNVDLVSQEVRVERLRSAGDTSGAHTLVAADGTRIEATQLVIAAGSRAERLDVPGGDLPQVHTSDTIMRLDELPARVLVVGGGYIASEFSGIFSGLGAEVVQVIRGDQLMRALDHELSERFTAEAERHWELRRGRTLRAVVPAEDGGVTAELDGPDGVERWDADVVLVAIGRRPNSDLVGAAAAGIDLHDDGRIVVDAFQRVLAGGLPVPGLYALGDISSSHQLKHVANHEARIVAHNLEHPDDLRTSRQDAVPAAVFAYPELAQVGLTESQAAEQFGAEHVTTKLQHYGDTAYGWAMADDSGVCKVVADRRDGRILGAHILGYQASNLIQPLITAMSFGIDARTFARGQYWVHPALMEVVENALLGLDVPDGDLVA